MSNKSAIMKTNGYMR